MEYMEFIRSGKYNEYDVCTCVDFLTRMCKHIDCLQCPLYLTSLVPHACYIKHWEVTDDRIKLKNMVKKMNHSSYIDEVYDVIGLSVGDKIKISGDTYRVDEEGLVNMSTNKLDKALLSDILTGQIKFKRR